MKYALKRLITGLGMMREHARPCYSLALAQVRGQLGAGPACTVGWAQWGCSQIPTWSVHWQAWGMRGSAGRGGAHLLGVMGFGMRRGR